MREYTFTVPAGQPEKKIEAMSLKKAMKSFQGGDAEEVTIEWTSRKGNPSSKIVKLPYKPRSERKGRL
jgi:ribosomal protein L21E